MLYMFVSSCQFLSGFVGRPPFDWVVDLLRIEVLSPQQLSGEQREAFLRADRYRVKWRERCKEAVGLRERLEGANQDYIRLDSLASHETYD